MPLYEYYCTRCAAKYELLRPMRKSDDPASCPSGHRGGTRVLSLFAANVKGGNSVRGKIRKLIPDESRVSKQVCAIGSKESVGLMRLITLAAEVFA